MNRKYPFKVCFVWIRIRPGPRMVCRRSLSFNQEQFPAIHPPPLFSMPLTCCENWVSCPAECPTFWIYLFSCVIIVFPYHLNFLKLEINSRGSIRLRLSLFRWECCVSHCTTIGKASLIYFRAQKQCGQGRNFSFLVDTLVFSFGGLLWRGLHFTRHEGGA